MTRSLSAAFFIILALYSLRGTVYGGGIDLTQYEPPLGTSHEDLRIGRVSFFDGKLLQAEDFQNEQQYIANRGRVRLVFDEDVHNLGISLAAANNGGHDISFLISIGPDTAHHDPASFFLRHGTTGTVVIADWPSRDVVIDALLDSGEPAAFGLRRIEFATAVPEPTSIVLVLTGLGLILRTRKIAFRPR